MKRLIINLLMVLLPFAAAAQAPQLTALASRLQTDRISLHYDCTFTQDTPVRLSGELLVQGECYQARGNGMEIYCDGKTRWTVDPASKEVYVETAESIEELALWQENMKDLSLTDVRYLPLSDDLSPFFFDTSVLDASWVVTDLR